MVNTPLPQSLKSEAKKAAKILREFTMPSAKSGPDKLIPAGILAKAKGLAIITVFKCGFLVTARGGSGIVIAKLRDDDAAYDYASGWSAPSAIGLAGLGGGFEVGLEVTDFVIILNTRSAVDAFSKGGNLTLGGNFTIAAGPLGRNVEGDISVRSPAAIYTYSKTKGIFVGISVEGSALIERKDANRKFYGKEIRAAQILNGDIDPPDECDDIYDVLKEHQQFALRMAEDMVKHKASKHKDKMVASSSSSYGDITFKKRSFKEDHRRTKSTKSTSSASGNQRRSRSEWTLAEDSPQASPGLTRKDSWSDPRHEEKRSSRRESEPAAAFDPWQDIDQVMLRGATATPPSSTSSRPSGRKSSQEAIWAVADFTFHAELSCDLSFKAGDRIKVTTRTASQQDWWEGLDSGGHQGIFPANYVHVVS